MSRELKIITCQPNDLLFNWQVRVQLANLRKYNLSKDYICLVRFHSIRDYPHVGANFKEEWDQLEKDYPEATFFYAEDETGVLPSLITRYNYIPLLRPWLLAKYFKLHPELKEKAILYMDSDVIFTREPNFGPLLDDDICYLTDTTSYIAASYFDGKTKDINPDGTNQEKYDRFVANEDVFGECMEMFGLTREIGMANEKNSGGAQYLLKNIDHEFWEGVFAGCLKIRVLLNRVNQRYFPGETAQQKEDKGFQVWCADMWSVLWNLWRTGHITRCPNEMDTCWATDRKDKFNEGLIPLIYHDAGAKATEEAPGHRLFHKRKPEYINNYTTPFEDDLSWVSPDYCSKIYVDQILEAKPQE